LTEIVHHNPMWINGETAAKYGIRTGDMVEITTYRAYGHAQVKGEGDVLGRARIPAYVTEGIHPRVLAISNTLGNAWHGRAATASNGARQNIPAFDKKVIDDDMDLDTDMWWDQSRGGTGAGYNVNAILPIQSAPLVGMQAWYDTVCTIRKV
jgi:thiosulfate reductase / polysulfide reductase chain A